MFLLAIGPPIMAGAWMVREELTYLITGIVSLMAMTMLSQLTAIFLALILGALLGVVMFLLGYGHKTSHE